MKILILCPNENTGGTERVASIYFRALTKNGNYVRLCSYFKPLQSFGLDTSTRFTETLYLSKKRKIFRPFILYLYLFIMRIKGYSILIQGEYAAVISLFLPFKVNIRITNDIDSISYKKKLFKNLLKISLKYHHILAPHKNIISKNLLLRKNINILPNPFSSDYLKKNEKQFNKYLLANKKFKFIAVGQLNFQKDHQFLLKTLKNIQVLNKFSFQLDIYGEGQEMKNLKKLIINLGLSNYVNLKGWSNNPWDQEQYIGHFLSSKWEGYPNVLVEAAFHNIPSLIVPIPPCTTQIIRENNIGFVSNARTIDSYSSLISNYMEDLLKGKNYDFQFPSFLNKHNPLLLIEAIK